MYYLSKQYLRDQHDQVEREMSGDRGCGAGWSFDGPPCGGCIDCAHAMVSHYFMVERERATKLQNLGLELVDPSQVKINIGATFEAHDWYACLAAGEQHAQKLARWSMRLRGKDLGS